MGNYFNEKERILLQVTEMTLQCPSKLELYKTTEGLYLMVNKGLNEKQKVDVMKMKVKNTEVKSAYSFMMAEQDSDKRKAQKTLVEMNLRSCYSFSNNLASLGSQSDQYHVIRDYKGKKVVIYTNNGIIYLTDCTQVSNVEIVKETSKCYENFGVIFKRGNITQTGWMDRYKTIINVGKTQNCNENNRIIMLNETHIAHKNAYTVSIEANPYFNSELTSLLVDIDKENYMHNKLILGGVNIISEINRRIAIKENGVEFFIKNSKLIQDEPQTFKSTIEDLKEKAVTLYNKFKLTIIITCCIILGLCIVNIIICCTCKICKCYFCCRKFNKLRSKRRKAVNMVELRELNETDRTISTSELDDTTRAMISRIKNKNRMIVSTRT